MMGDRAAILSSWAEADRAIGLLPADRALIEAAGSLRALIVDLRLSRAEPDELFDACAALGRVIAAQGGSPSYASATLDGASAALGSDAGTASWLVPARAALMEAFATALAEAAHRDADQAWEFPRCAVPLGQAGLAVAAGLPSDDEEVIAAWAARVAKSAALSGIRRAVVSGSERACAALLDAFGIVGIEAQHVPMISTRR